MRAQATCRNSRGAALLVAEFGGRVFGPAVLTRVGTAAHARRPGNGMYVLITAAARGAVFGLAHSQAGQPPNVVKRASRMIRLLVDATAAQVIR